MTTSVARCFVSGLLVVGLSSCATTAASSSSGSPVAKTSQIETDGDGNVDGDDDDDDDSGTEPAPLPGPPPGPNASGGLGEGVASVYSNRLRGRRTASGERYRPKLFTCAHRSLPFGTVLLVENLHTGATVRCRVNDRGPFIDGRIIDLSRQTARGLGMVDVGLMDVRISIALERASDAAPATSSRPDG